MSLIVLFLVISLGFFILKIVLVIRINNGAISCKTDDDNKVLRSLGVSFSNYKDEEIGQDEDRRSARRIAQTFLSEVVSLAVSILLLIG